MRRTFKMVVMGFLGGTALMLGLGLGIVFHYSKVIPDIQSVLKDYEPSTVTTVYARNGDVIAEFFNERRYVVPLESVPKHLIDAFVAAEDQHFYAHKGLDYWGIFRAFAHNLLAGGLVEGGSTITQQLTRNLLRLRGRSLSRKVKEALLAFRIEKNLTKDEILYLYLNQIFLGHGAYGVEAAAQMYFQKSTPDLTLSESAFLAGLTPAPNTYSPYSNSESSKRRQRYVLRRMVEDGYVTDEEANEAWDEPLEVHPLPEDNIYAAHYFVEQVRRHLEAKYGTSGLYSRGLKVYTTVDTTAQEAAEGTLRRGLERIERTEGYRGPIKKLTKPGEISEYLTDLALRQEEFSVNERIEGVVVAIDKKARALRVDIGGRVGLVRLDDHPWLNSDPSRSSTRLFNVGDVLAVRLRKESPAGIILALDPEPGIQGAIVAVDVRSGEIRAMVGGYDFATSKFNRTVQAKRQAGSAFKPVIYAAALENGFTPSTMLYDTPVVLPFRLDDEEEMWKPKNFEKEFKGATTFREGLIHSRNIVTVKILRELGVDKVIEFARSLGVTAPLEDNLSLALGSSAISPLELSVPYLVFASGGIRVEPILIRAVYTRDGELVEGKDVLKVRHKAQPLPQGEDPPGVTSPMAPGAVVSPQIAYLMTHLLREVIWFGTGHTVMPLGRPAAGKTGTTNDHRDAWFVGYTPQMLATVWVGYDDARSMGSRATGTAYAAPIWLDFMQAAMDNEPIEEFVAPEGVVFVKIDAQTGLRAIESSKKVVYEAYLSGTEPQEYAPDPDQLDPDKFYESDLGF